MANESKTNESTAKTDVNVDSGSVNVDAVSETSEALSLEAGIPEIELADLSLDDAQGDEVSNVEPAVGNAQVQLIDGVCVVSGADASKSLTASIIIEQPENGESVSINVVPGQEYFFDFNKGEVRSFVQEGDDLTMKFADGSSLVLLGFGSTSAGIAPATLAFSEALTIGELQNLIQVVDTTPAESDAQEPESELREVADSESGETGDDGALVALVQPAAGESEAEALAGIETAAGEEVANIEPAAGGNDGNSGYGFNSSFDAQGVQGLNDVGPINPTALQYGVEFPTPEVFGFDLNSTPEAIGSLSNLDETGLGPASVSGVVAVDFGNDGPGQICADGTFSITGSLMDGEFTSGGEPITVTMKDDASGYTGTLDDGTEVFDLTIDKDTGEYTFTQFGPLDHEDDQDDNDVINVNFGVVAIDEDGDETNTTITIAIADDAPLVADPDENTIDENALADGPVIIEDSLDIDFGNDVPGCVIPNDSTSVEGVAALTSNGEAVTLVQTESGYEGQLPGGSLAFSLVINKDTGEYTFVQFTPLDHGDNDVISIDFGVDVQDFDGDSTQTTITINFVDSVPVINPNPTIGSGVENVDETNLTDTGLSVSGSVDVDFGADGTGQLCVDGEFGVSGSLLNGEFTSGGEAITVNALPGDDGYQGTLADGSVIFTLVVDKTNGDYTFTQDGPLDHADGGDPDDEITLTFGIFAEDGDGDRDFGTIVINVADDGPLIAEPVERNADEGDLVDGNIVLEGTLDFDFGNDGAGSVEFSGDNEVRGVDALTSNGEAVSVALVDGQYVGTLPNGDEVFTLSVDPATGDYTFTQILPLDHADGSDTISLDFDVDVSDFDGDQASSKITINIIDSVPVIDANPSHGFGLEVVDETDWADGLSVSGSVNVDFGGDVPGALTPNNTTSSSTPLLSGGQVVTIVPVEGGYVGQLDDGTEVFAITIDPTNGDYTFTQSLPLDHPNAGDADDAIDISFGVVATDGDGDTDSGAISITVKDDGPIANDDATTYDTTTGTASGNVIDNDDLSTDDGPSEAQDHDVVQVSFQGTVVDVVPGQEATIEGEYGTLSISDDGSYTYQLNEGAGFPDGDVSCLDPVAADADGISDTFSRDGITISVANEGNFDITWVDTTTNNLGAGFGILNLDGDTGGSKIFPFGEAFDIDFDVPATSVELTIADLGSNNNSGQYGADFVITFSDGTTLLTEQQFVADQIEGGEFTFTVDSLDYGGKTISSIELFSTGAEGQYRGASMLLSNVKATHAGEDCIVDEFEYVLQDGDGDRSTATLELIGKDLTDDTPIDIGGRDATDDDNTIGDNSDVQTGIIDVDYQSDNAGKTVGAGSDSFGVSGQFAGPALSSNGIPVSVTFNSDTNTYTGMAGSLVVFTMVINADATYAFTQNEALDHSNTGSDNEALFLDFGVTAIDADGDTGTGSVQITVRDSGPEAEDDKTNVDEGEAVQGNVIDNDDQGADTPASVTSISFGDQSIDVPANGSETITGDFGDLTINSDGSYEYVANGAASQTIRGFEISDFIGGTGAGKIELVQGSLNEATNEFTFSYTIQGDQANGFTLVLNDGANPKGVAGELPQFFFDNSGDVPVISVYGYNGLGGVPGTTASALDGSQEDGVQAPDQIATSLSDNSPFSNIVVTDNGDGTQTFGFTMDATELNAHTPLYDDAGEWQGLSFGETAGGWFHPVSGLESAYDDNGYLTQFDFTGRSGWDGNHLPTNTSFVYGEDQFEYTITDADGDTSTATLDLCIDSDPGPTGIYAENSTDDTNVRGDNMDMVTGDITVNFNGEEPGITAGNDYFRVGEHSLPNGTLSSNGVAIEVEFDGDTGTYTGKAGDLVVFTMTINDDATYKFTQFEAVDHANTASNNETLFLQFGVTALDQDGDAGDGIVQIRVRDDASRAKNDNNAADEGQTVNGNVVNNDDLSADAPSIVTNVQIGEESYVLNPDGSNTVIVTDHGTLTINNSGAYSYAGSDEGRDEFIYTLSDADGDTSTARLRLDVTDVNFPIDISGRGQTDDTDLADGGTDTASGIISVDYQGDEPGVTTGNNDFNVGGEFAGDALSSDGVAVDVVFDSATNTYTGTAGENVVFTMVINSDATFDFTQFAALDHSDTDFNNEALLLNFGVTATDDDQDSASGVVTISVRDDGPSIYGQQTPTDEDSLVNGEIVTANGTIRHSFGEDGPGTIRPNGEFMGKFATDGEAATMSSGGREIIVTPTDDGYEGTIGDLVIFRFSVEDDGSYNYMQFAPLDHPNTNSTNEALWLKFGVEIVDGDGDVKSTFIDIDVNDSAPDAQDDSNQAEGDAVVETLCLDPEASDVSSSSDSSFTKDGITVSSNNGQDLTWFSDPTLGSGVGIAGAGSDKVFNPSEVLRIAFAIEVASAVITLGDIGSNNIGNEFTYEVFLADGASVVETVTIDASSVENGSFTFNVNGYDDEISGVDLIGGPSFVLNNVKADSVETGAAEANGNVLANDGLSADSFTNVVKVKFNGETFEVPEGGFATIEGDFGDLIIGSNGGYTYKADEPTVETVYSFSRDNPGGRDNAGDIKTVSTNYNETTEMLDFSFAIAGEDADGFTLVLNDGPVPRDSQSGELAIFYFDGSDTDNPVISTYGYNGQNDFSSFRDGSSADGIQAADRIVGSNDDNSPFSNIRVETDANGCKVFTFSVNADMINDHDSLYGDAGAPWKGVEFQDLAGIWLHVMSDLETSYDENGNLTEFSYDQQSWWDGADIPTQVSTTTQQASGQDVFEYTIEDADGDRSSADLAINVGGETFAVPQAVPQIATIDADGNVTQTHGFIDEDGNAELYGTDGVIDTFVFDNNDQGFSTIYDFNQAEGDILDVSALLGQYDSVQDSINDFVFTTETDSQTIVLVDQSGSGDVSQSTQIAVLDGVTELNLELATNNGETTV